MKKAIRKKLGIKKETISRLEVQDLSKIDAVQGGMLTVTCVIKEVESRCYLCPI